MAQKKTGLGRGLDGLISGGIAQKKAAPATVAEIPEGLVPMPKKDKEAAAPLAGLHELPLNRIEPNPHQPRRDFEEASLKELAESIRAEGLLQPVVVRPVGQNYQLIAGERRWRACKLLGLKRILARVLEVSEASSAVLSLVENLQRADLNAIEEAMGYASLMRDFDLTQEAVAERVGKGRATIANSLRLLQLDAEIQGYLGRDLLSAGHAKVLLSLEAAEQRVLLARRIIEERLSVRETERAVEEMRRRRSNGSGSSRTPPQSPQALDSYAKHISRHLGTPVHFRQKAKKGHLVIEYYGAEDLQRILDKLGLPSA